ncbi:MAG TPA: TIGR02253 family HAD-type hydrolase [archaeon]|nr:TIGR02253 family HAD-type hydrolase [archaeon]
MIKAILFDLDNTLIDFVKLKFYSIDAAIDAMISNGLKMSKKSAEKSLFRLYNKHGIEYQLIFQKFLEESMGKIDYRLLAAAISAYRKAKASELKPYPSVIPTLRKLKRKYRLGIISDAPRLQAWIRLADLELLDLFDVVITKDDTGVFKPNPKPYIKALKILNAKPDEAMFVGDAPARDLKGAKNVGMKTCFAKYGFAEKVTIGYDASDPKVKPDYVINSISELLKIVQKNASTAGGRK